jgi:phenylalanyl-tRNA synthetase alpha chain
MDHSTATPSAPAEARLADIGDAALEAIAAATDLDELDEVRQSTLGKKGAISLVKRELGGMDPDARRTVGQAVNDVTARVTAALEERRAALEVERDRVILAAEAIDVTLPPRMPRTGTLHPLRQTLDAILDVFVGLGYEVVTGPEVESDWFNFDALNTPMDHPARTLQDTIYVSGLEDGAPTPRADGASTPRADGSTGLLLRTQTSPMQIRTMLDRQPPVYVAVPGRVYRQDTPDATHVPVFHQIEGLAVDTDLSMADLYGTLMAFARALVGDDVRLRFRPHYFPFTEPSAELDAWVPDGDGGGRWMELLGSGMVHPRVLEAGGYDPEQVQGFAFGIGIERTAMVRYGVPDLRLFAENDVRLLASF